MFTLFRAVNSPLTFSYFGRKIKTDQQFKALLSMHSNYGCVKTILEMNACGGDKKTITGGIQQHLLTLQHLFLHKQFCWS